MSVPNVITYTSKTRIQKPSIVFVKAEWCPHCQTTKPEIGKAAEILGSVLPIYMIDGDKHKADIDRKLKLKVDGYPTIVFLGRNGEMTQFKEGARTGKKIADWACAHSGNCGKSMRR